MPPGEKNTTAKIDIDRPKKAKKVIFLNSSNIRREIKSKKRPVPHMTTAVWIKVLNFHILTHCGKDATDQGLISHI